MSITTIWSPMHGVGATACLLATAICMAEAHDRKVLITETHFALNNLEEPLLGKSTVDARELHAGKGIDTLKRYAASSGIDADTVRKVSFDVSDKIMFMPGTMQTEYELHDSASARNVIQHSLFETGRVMSDYNVIIDTNAGDNDAMSAAALDIADNIVVCLRQNKALIAKTLENEKLIELSQSKGMFFCFAEYDDDSKLNLDNVPKIFKPLKGGALGGVPYNTGYADAISDCTVLKYLRRTIDLYDPKTATANDWWRFVDNFTQKII